MYKICGDIFNKIYLLNKIEKLGIQNASRFSYLNRSGCYDVESMDDSKEFQDVLNAMSIINISQENQNVIFKIIAGILHLGNVNFVPNGNYSQPEHDRRNLTFF